MAFVLAAFLVGLGIKHWRDQDALAPLAPIGEEAR